MLHLTTQIPLAPGRHLYGDVYLPLMARGIVLFVHGSGSNRASPRNRLVAREMQRLELGTFLLDLLDPTEAQQDSYTRELRFDIALLRDRVLLGLKHLGQMRETAHLPIGLYGSSTGAAAALWAANETEAEIKCVVSRGGRPDLCPPEVLAALNMPVLFIVGGYDHGVLEMNQEVARHLKRCKVEVIPGATHLFEEPGAMDAVSHIASRFIQQHFLANPPASPPSPPPSQSEGSK